jgi:hypothetical protein
VLSRLWIGVVVLMMFGFIGCGPNPVVGGTRGVLLADGAPVADVQVSVYQPEEGSWQPIGFADTASDGTFRLLLNEARGPLQLDEGQYRFTLQSVGAPLVIPRELSAVETTPLQASWSGDEPQLTLNLKQKLVQSRR